MKKCTKIERDEGVGSGEKRREEEGEEEERENTQNFGSARRENARKEREIVRK